MNITNKHGDSKSDVLLCFDLNLNLKCIINFLKVLSISKDYFICHHQDRLVEWSKA